MTADYCETFVQDYDDGKDSITCWWGVVGDSVSFLVFDRTNGLSDYAQIRLQAGDKGNVAILTTQAGEEQLNGCEQIVEIASNDLRRITMQFTAQELDSYLNSSDYALEIVGIEAFLADHRRTT